MNDLEDRLRMIVFQRPDLMSWLRVVRLCDPPNWLIAAGAVRSAVWDHLHGYPVPTSLPDVDVVFFDPDDLSQDRENEIESALEELWPTHRWQVKNQAAVHLWFENKFGVCLEPLSSIEAALATWSETATAVGLRLLADDSLVVVAPLGLDDLFGLKWRRIPGVPKETFLQRWEEKEIQKIWPKVTLLEDGNDLSVHGSK